MQDGDGAGITPGETRCSPCSITVALQPQDRTAATTLALLWHATHVLWQSNLSSDQLHVKHALIPQDQSLAVEQLLQVR